MISETNPLFLDSLLRIVFITTLKGEDEDMTSMVKKLVLDQHRTMFYTVTISPQTQRKIENSKVVAPSLKVAN